MNLRIKQESAGTQGKSRWVLTAEIDGKHVEIARSPHNYGTINNCQKGIKRFKQAIGQAIADLIIQTED